MAYRTDMGTPRVLVTDLDGTLVHDRRVDPADAQALARWRKAGNLLVVATGRSVMLARLALADTAQALGGSFEADYIICASGTTLLDGQGRVIRADVLPADEVERATRFLMARQDCAVVATTLEGDYLLHNPLPPGNRFHAYASRYTPARLEEVLGIGVTSMPVCVPDDAVAQELVDTLIQRSGGRISAPRSTEYLDIVPVGQDKGSALGHLHTILSQRGIDIADVAAVGDSWNDIPMFAVADHACAMTSAVADCRDAALAAGGTVLPSVADFVAYLEAA